MHVLSGGAVGHECTDARDQDALENDSESDDGRGEAHQGGCVNCGIRYRTPEQVAGFVKGKRSCISAYTRLDCSNIVMHIFYTHGIEHTVLLGCLPRAVPLALLIQIGSLKN